MMYILKTAIIISFIAIVSACGGSDSGGQPASKTFTVELVATDVRRISNGDTIDVDTSNISSGPLTLNQ